MKTNSKEAPILTVSQLTQALKLTLESTFPLIWVQGEVSNFRAQSSGHYYFTLKDSGAQISAVMFRGDAAGLKAAPKDGDKVVMRGELNLYERSGKYQIVVRELKLQGLGELLLRLEELKKVIHQRGWFSKEHKKPLPVMPKTIGVVTSPTGAVIQDILNVLTRRFSGFHLILNPVRVQGDQAAAEIAQAIDQFNRYNLVDVIIIGRGGGSIEDLWAFNEEIVAKAVFESKIPIIAAVGHETDHCIAEYVADARAPTPSAAAEMVIAERKEKIRQIDQCKRRLLQIVAACIKAKRKQLDLLRQQPLFASPTRLLEPREQRLDEIKQGMDAAISGVVKNRGVTLASFKRSLSALTPMATINHYRQKTASIERTLFQMIDSRLRDLKREIGYREKTLVGLWAQLIRRHRIKFNERVIEAQFDHLMKRALNENSNRLQALGSALHAVNPKQLLARGYSILFAEKDRSVINSVRQLNKDECCRLMLADGEVITQIKEVIPSE